MLQRVRRLLQPTHLHLHAVSLGLRLSIACSLNDRLPVVTTLSSDSSTSSEAAEAVGKLQLLALSD